MTRLTEHFTLEELWHSDAALRMGIDNRPPPQVLPALTLTAQGLERVRAALGGLSITVNSGYRCEELEHALCGKDYGAWCVRERLMPSPSAWRHYFERKGHPKGFCADFTCRAFGAPAEVIREVLAARVPFDQMIEEGTWVHGSFDPRQRGEVLTARFNEEGTPTYTHGLAA